MSRNPAAQTAFGPMVLSAIEHQEPAANRLVDDDLAASFLPMWLRCFTSATRVAALRHGLIAASERASPGMWSTMAARKRYINDNLDRVLGDIDAVVVLG